MKKSQNKDKGNAISRREFLTTTGLAATGAVIAGTATAQNLPPARPDRGRQGGRRPEAIGPKIRKKLNARYTTPVSKDKLNISELKSERVVKQEIEVLATQLARGIDRGLFDEVDITRELDDLHQDADLSSLLTGINSIPDLVESITNGMNCWGDGTDITSAVGGAGSKCGIYCKGNEGDRCGNNCKGDEGNTCGTDCGKAKGDNCGKKCPESAAGEQFNPFIENFMEATGVEYLDPAVNIIMQFHTAEIIRQVVSQAS